MKSRTINLSPIRKNAKNILTIGVCISLIFGAPVWLIYITSIFTSIGNGK